MTDRAPDADRQLDERLAAAGARWRAAQPAAPEPDPALLTTPRQPRWQPLAAAAAVLAITAGGVAGIAVFRRGDPSPAAGRVVGQTASPVVHDGDRVAGYASVVARPGQPVRLCLPGITVAIPDPPPPACETGIPVVGVELARLSSREERYGVVWGSASLEGVYRDGALTVTRQEATPAPSPGPPRKDPSAPDRVPCPAPSGGWTRPPQGTGAAVARLTQLVGRRAQELVGPWVAYPYGWHLQDTSNRKGTEVYLIGTTGDPAAARSAAEQVFPAEHLCVVGVAWSKAAMDAAERRLRTPEARRLGFGLVTANVLDDAVEVDVAVLDEAASRFLAGTGDGRVVPKPLLEKVP